MTVEGFGHTVLINPNACAQERITAYLIEGELPPLGARCGREGSSFTPR